MSILTPRIALTEKFNHKEGKKHSRNIPVNSHKNMDFMVEGDY
jgi:hypothetical protein